MLIINKEDRIQIRTKSTEYSHLLIHLLEFKQIHLLEFKQIQDISILDTFYLNMFI